MASVTVHFLGSGDAFGSGARFQTCFFVKSDATRFLIDCGSMSLVAMKRFGVSPMEIDTVLLTHLHGDHFGGLPFLLIEADHISKRTRPLAIIGPSGIKRRLVDAMEVMFPGASRITLCYPLEVLELVPAQPFRLGTITVTGYVVEHECGAPPLALRIECEGRVITYSGDTVWTESLARAAKNADLFIAEAYTFERKTKLHMDLQTLISHLSTGTTC